MVTSKRNRYDRIFIGFFVGILAPLVTFLITYSVKNTGQSVVEYLEIIWSMKIFLKIFSLCILSNLAFFFLFLQLKYEMAARGVLTATFIYAFGVLIAKLL